MNRKIFAVAVFSLLVDQVSKILINIFLNVEERIVIIKNFFSLYLIENDGAAWSILSEKIGFLIVMSMFALFIITRYMYNFKQNKRNNIAFGLIIGGIFGNLLDRIFLGYVRDFLSFKIFSYQYPIFNFADVSIVVGVFLLCLAILKGEDKNEQNNR